MFFVVRWSRGSWHTLSSVANLENGCPLSLAISLVTYMLFSVVTIDGTNKLQDFANMPA